LVKTGGGALHSIALNYLNPGDTVLVYDGVDATGALMGVIGTDLSQPALLLYDAKIETGIFIDRTGQGVIDLTVNWV